MKILFILKKRQDYYNYNYIGLSTGLYNSAKFISDILIQNNIQSKISIVNDNNDIDKEISQYNPTHVIIEALWVVPDKFKILNQLHPNVKFIIRTHSDSPFIAQEGIAIKWLREYTNYKNTYIATNSLKFKSELELINNTNIIYLPNYYPINTLPKYNSNILNKPIINIGCFGAIRPLKNHLTQAIAAIRFSKGINKPINFHINITEQDNINPIYHNLKALFQNTPNNLIEHQWLPHEDFISFIKYNIDIGLQVSFSETFNIVAADIISNNIPIVTSNEIPWMKVNTANPTSSIDINNQLINSIDNTQNNITQNINGLSEFNSKSVKAWKNLTGYYSIIQS